MTKEQNRTIDELFQINSEMGSLVTNFSNKNKILSKEFASNILNDIVDTDFIFSKTVGDKKLFTIMIETTWLKLHLFTSVSGTNKVSVTQVERTIQKIIKELDKIPNNIYIELLKMLESLSDTIFSNWRKIIPQVNELSDSLSNAIIKHAESCSVAVGTMNNRKVGLSLYGVVDGKETVGELTNDAEWSSNIDGESLFTESAIPREYIITEINKKLCKVEHYTYHRYNPSADEETNNIKIKTGVDEIELSKLTQYFIDNSVYHNNKVDAMSTYLAMEQASDLLKFTENVL